MKTCANCANEIRNKAIYCDICGAVGGVETYEIKIHLQNPKGIMYLGRKDVCYTCRDTHLADYIAKNGLGPVDGVDMKGC